MCEEFEIEKNKEKNKKLLTFQSRDLNPRISVIFRLWFEFSWKVRSLRSNQEKVLKKIGLYMLLIVLLVVKGWNRQHHSQTIHPTEKFTSMNLYKIIGVVTWAWLFLSSTEVARGQTPYNNRTLWRLVHPTVPVLLIKRNNK